MSASANPDIVTDGLVLCLDAADKKSYSGSGTTWTDRSGNGNSGTLTNGPTFDSGNGGSIDFDGTNDHITTSLDLSWNDTSDASVFITVTPASLQTRAIIGKGNSQWEWQINQDNAGLQLVYWNTGGSHSNGPITTISNVFEANVTVSVGIVWSSSDNKHYFYKNGVQVGNNTWTDASINQNRSNGVHIGGNIYQWGLGGNYWSGTIHNAVLYDKALTDAEVLQNYNATKSRFNL
jgi:hypothetical protein